MASPARAAAYSLRRARVPLRPGVAAQSTAIIWSAAAARRPREARAVGAGVESRGRRLRRSPEILLTRDAQERIVDVPMARIRTAERTLRGRSLLSFGALACTPGQYLDHKDQPGRRELANAGRPVVRW